MSVVKTRVHQHPKPVPGKTPEVPKSSGSLLDTPHNLAVFLLTVGAIIGFTHKFGYMQRLGLNMELGDEKPTQLAVDSLQSVQGHWQIYGWLVLATIILMFLRTELKRRNAPWVNEGLVTGYIVCAFLGSLAYYSFITGQAEAVDFLGLRFGVDETANYQQIVLPQSAASDAGRCFAPPTPTPPSVGKKQTKYYYVVAETSDTIHVIQIDSAVEPGKRLPNTVILQKSLVPCYQRVIPGLPQPAPLATQSATPPNRMPPTPPAAVPQT